VKLNKPLSALELPVHRFDHSIAPAVHGAAVRANLLGHGLLRLRQLLVAFSVKYLWALGLEDRAERGLKPRATSILSRLKARIAMGLK